MNKDIRYDTIQWSCDFDNSRINVTAYDLDNQADIAKQMTFKEVLGMITDDCNGNHIDVTQEVLKLIISRFDYEVLEHYEEEEQTQKFGAYAFFAELDNRRTENWMTTETKIEYVKKVTQAISDLLEGKKKLLSLNEI